MKKIPQRTCLGCQTKKNKNELIRIVKDKDGNIFVDETGKQNGRGAYLCSSLECLEKAIKTKKLEREFETKIDEEVYENLRSVIALMKDENKGINLKLNGGENIG